jgi:transposase
MDIPELLQTLLKLPKSGWEIVAVQADVPTETLFVELEYKADMLLMCPECGSDCSGHIYDHYERTWRHKDLCEYRTMLHAKVPRVSCKKCNKVVMISVPWSDKQMRVTRSFERQLVNGCILMPISDVRQLYHVSWYTICNALERTINELLKKKTYDAIKIIGVDEIAIHKGHEYLTLVYDLEKSEVIWMGKGRQYTTLLDFISWFGIDKFQQLDAICCDMWDPFIKAITQYVEPSKIVFDKFHIKQHLNVSVDKTRRMEHKELLEMGQTDLTYTKYLWLKNPSHLTVNQQQTFKELRKKNLKVLRAYELKELFSHFWQFASPTWAEKFFNDWYWSATHSRLSPVVKVAKMLKRYWYGVISYIKHPITNATSEGINSKIRVYTKRAFGFRTFEMFRNIVFLGCGGLNIDPFKSS